MHSLLQQIIKIALLGLGTLFALLCLNSCALSPLNVVAVPTEGYPDLAQRGLLVKFVVTGGNGTIAVDFGDGANGKYETETFTHLYVTQGDYSYIVMRGIARTTGKITVLNDPPYVRRPSSGIYGTVEEREKVIFNPSYTMVGCRPPFQEWGINDPNDDSLMIRVTAFRENGKPESLFIPNHPDNSTLCRDDDSPGIFTPEDAKRINGEWIPIQPFIWFAGWTWGSPPIPLGIIPAGFYVVNFTMEARDRWGGYGRTEWNETAQKGCGI